MTTDTLADHKVLIGQVDKTFRLLNPKIGSPNHLNKLRLKSNLSEEVLPGVEVIGAAYNPFGEYASAQSISSQIFDWNKAPQKTVTAEGTHFQIPEVVDFQQADKSDYVSVSGETVNSFQSNFSNTVSIGGNYNLFSASISTEYTSSELRKSENEFSRIQQNINVWSLRLPIGADLRTLLRADFRTYLDNLPNTDAAARELFENYGSHFLTGVVMGGRTVYASSTNKLTVNRDYSIEVVAKASYGWATGQISAEDKTKYSQAVSSFQRTSSVYSAVLGGSGIKAAHVFEGKAGFDAWVDSVGTSPDFVAFVNNGPMQPIWKLIAPAQADKAHRYEAYFNQTWGPEQSRKAQIYADYVDDLTVIVGDNSGIQPPSGYTKIPYDLNKGAGGKYIYLCFHKESFHPIGENKKSIDDIVIVYGKDAPPPAGYTKIPNDLNQGAGGDYIYLCYRKVDYNNVSAIKDVTVIGGGDPNVPPPYGFTKVPGDLNKGAGGDYIYACYSKNA